MEYLSISLSFRLIIPAFDYFFIISGSKMSSISLIQPDRDLFSWPQYWPPVLDRHRFCPMSREEMDQLGWDSCDIILVTGDAYVDSPKLRDGDLRSYAGSTGLSRRDHRPARLEQQRRFHASGKPNLFFVLLLATWIR
ncbi:radical SAM superfamily protein [Escherichia coli]|uniref:Radical SAM superfamily protein n=1 Tax=Escherichia coli TaxID=562 RepID=A0A2X3K0E3_ECOLX|nr:radical SAM superfamily protein [Escherichia coli]